MSQGRFLNPLSASVFILPSCYPRKAPEPLVTAAPRCTTFYYRRYPNSTRKKIMISLERSQPFRMMSHGLADFLASRALLTSVQRQDLMVLTCLCTHNQWPTSITGSSSDSDTSSTGPRNRDMQAFWIIHLFRSQVGSMLRTEIDRQSMSMNRRNGFSDHSV